MSKVAVPGRLGRRQRSVRSERSTCSALSSSQTTVVQADVQVDRAHKPSVQRAVALGRRNTPFRPNQCSQPACFLASLCQVTTHMHRTHETAATANTNTLVPQLLLQVGMFKVRKFELQIKHLNLDSFSDPSVFV